MPQVHYDIGEMYGGQIPIDESDPSRLLYFVFKPAIDASAPNDEVTIYLNVGTLVVNALMEANPIHGQGGPGCSSMDAFFQESMHDYAVDVVPRDLLTCDKTDHLLGTLVHSCQSQMRIRGPT